MRKRSLAALAALLLLAPLAGGAAPSGAAPTRGTPSMSGLAPAPPSDLGAWWLHSALDADGSGVHDALERLSLGEFPTVIVVDYGLPKNRVARWLAYHVVKQYEPYPYANFVKADVAALLEGEGIELKDHRPALLGVAQIVTGRKRSAALLRNRSDPHERAP